MRVCMRRPPNGLRGVAVRARALHCKRATCLSCGFWLPQAGLCRGAYARTRKGLPGRLRWSTITGRVAVRALRDARTEGEAQRACQFQRFPSLRPHCNG